MEWWKKRQLNWKKSSMWRLFAIKHQTVSFLLEAIKSNRIFFIVNAPCFSCASNFVFGVLWLSFVFRFYLWIRKIEEIPLPFFDCTHCTWERYKFTINNHTLVLCGPLGTWYQLCSIEKNLGCRSAWTTDFVPIRSRTLFLIYYLSIKQ